MRPGDRVASRDPATGRLVAATVDRTHTHARVPTIRLTTTSGTVTTTATHPVHVAGRGYVPAGRLRAGDTLTTPDHAPVHVVSVQATGHTTTVHNLTIRHTHNYHVHTTTKQAILVHNNGTNKTPGACDPPEPDEVSDSIFLFRTPNKGDKQYELDHGLDPAKFQGLDKTAYVGDEAVAQEFSAYARHGYEDGYVQYEMDPRFLDEFGTGHEYVATTGPDSTAVIGNEWHISAEKMDLFNELTRSRTWKENPWDNWDGPAAHGTF